MTGIANILSLLAAIGAATSILAITAGILRWLHRPGTMRARLQEVGNLHLDIEPELQRPLMERAVRPLFASAGQAILRVTSRRSANKIQMLIKYANFPEGFINTFVTLRTVAAAGSLIFVLVYVSIMRVGVFQWILLFSALGVGAYMMPYVWLSMKARSRQDAIRRSLPDLIDLLTLCLGGNMEFEQALERIVEKSRSAARDEFAIVLGELRLHQPLNIALTHLADRVGLDELRSFATTVNHSRETGTPLLDALLTQSADMRMRRRLRAETLARQAPIKMMFPLIFFIFPPLIIVIMGPMIPQLLHMFAPNLHL
jgi:tight adherence protein C